MQSEAEAIFEHSDFCYTASNVTLSISPTSRTTRISSPLLSGGALGIGAALVSLLHSAGAHVFFSHVLTEPAEALLHDLTPSSSTGQKLHFIHTDVADYASNLHLFRTAYEVCGRIDHAVSAAGIGEKGNIFDPELTLETVQECKIQDG
ncbi:hypothetical protein LTR60_001092 [Cryomyces antarcticus]|nr:hypothetical protein LTR39_001219 [Cryomyces antarcticus]KAK5019523.1 hypothetical protein LTR60_001092 [Cryomyces antarcticus]